MTLIGRSPENIVRNTARTNPALKDALDSIVFMSDEEIAALPFQPHLRKGLQKIKNDKVAVMNGEKEPTLTLADIEPYIVASFVPDVMGECFRYAGDSTYVGNLFVNSGEYVFCPETGGMWIDTIFYKTIPAIRLVFDSKCSFKEYKGKVREYQNGSFTGQILDSGSTASGAAFQILRF